MAEWLPALQLPVALSVPDLLAWAATLDLSKLHDGKSPAAIVYLVHAWFEQTRPTVHMEATPMGPFWLVRNVMREPQRVLILADVKHAGVGDRILQAQVAHAAIEAGAEVTVLWSVPTDYQHYPVHRRAREIIQWFYPDCGPLASWGSIAAATPDSRNAIRLADFDLVLAMTHCGDYGYKVDTRYETMRDAVKATLGLDLKTHRPYRAPPRDPRLLDKYIAVQTTATSYPEACGAAIKLGREMARRAEAPLVLLGLNDGRVVEGDCIDLRDADFATTIGAVKYATAGVGPDSMCAHAAGFYGVPWIAIANFKRAARPRWWCGGYGSVRLIDLKDAHRKVAEILGLSVVQSDP